MIKKCNDIMPLKKKRRSKGTISMNKESITETTLRIAKGQKAVVIDDVKTPTQPNYYKIGNSTVNKDGIESINLVKEMVRLSMPARQMIEMIMDRMIYDPFYYGKDLQGKWIGGVVFDVTIIPNDNTERQILKRGYKELREKNLVRRIKRSHYMINPKAVITEYARQMIVWEESE